MKIIILPIIIALISLDFIEAYSQNEEANSPHEISLPSEVDKIILAKSGDVLLLQMNKLSKVMVFDVKTEKIIYPSVKWSETV